MKKIFAIILTLALLISFAACSKNENPAEKADDGVINVGVCQLVQHDALDAATKGFVDTLTEKYGDKVKIDLQNASGDSATCGTICNQFVADKVDLIMANATPALLAAAASTAEIPIVGTSITHYGSALDIPDWNGTTGSNITGTSDLADLAAQAAMVQELFPDAKTVGILFCSAEANSVYQSEVLTENFTKLGITAKNFTFADSNEVTNVVTAACGECDVLFIPTDNTAATCAENINNVALPAGVPIICGEEGPCAVCGVATLSISYYDIGVEAGKMAIEILENGTNAGEMQIRFAPTATKKFNKEICEKLGVEVPSDYVVIE